MAHDSLNPDNDPFAPPVISTIVHCIHCGEEYDSYRIEWCVEQDADGQPHGFWCCPMPGCDGKGFGFDIFPVDPAYRDEDGELMWVCDDEEDDELDDDFEDDAVGVGFDDDFDDDDDEDSWFVDEETPFGKFRGGRDEDLPF